MFSKIEGDLYNILEELDNIEYILSNKVYICIGEEIEIFKHIIKDNKYYTKKANIKKQILKKLGLNKSNKRNRILKKARKKAHTILADNKRNISNNMKI